MSDELDILGKHVRREQSEPLESIGDPERAKALSEPLGDADRDRIVAKILAMRASSTAPAPASSNVVQGPSRWFRRVAPVVALAAAAAAAFVVMKPGPDAIPEFSASAISDKDLRGDTSGSQLLRVRKGSVIEIVVRPAKAVEGRLTARTYIVRNGQYAEWAALVELSPSGAVRIRGTADPLVGADEVRVVVGRPELLKDASDKARQKGGADRGWQTLSFDVETLPPSAASPTPSQ